MSEPASDDRARAGTPHGDAKSQDPAAAFRAGESSLTNDEAALEAGVGRAVESALSAKALDISLLPFGKVNRVYVVNVEGGPAVVVKVFAYVGWPEDGKPEWLEKQLTLHSVPHARLLHCSRNAEHFPNGFAVYEHAGGRNCVAAMREGTLAVSDYCRLAGAFLRRVHAVEVERYGYLGGGGCGTDEDFIESKLAYDVRDRLGEVDSGALDVGLIPRVERAVRRLLLPLAGRFRPRLVHGDAAPRNGLLDDGRLLLVDWDEAASSIWPEDFTRLSYWFAYLRRADDPAESRERVRRSFFEGYGEAEFDARELSRIERALHIILSADLLSYYYKTKNIAGFNQAQGVLDGLLSP